MKGVTLCVNCEVMKNIFTLVVLCLSFASIAEEKSCREKYPPKKVMKERMVKQVVETIVTKPITTIVDVVVDVPRNVADTCFKKVKDDIKKKPWKIITVWVDVPYRCHKTVIDKVVKKEERTELVEEVVKSVQEKVEQYEDLIETSEYLACVGFFEPGNKVADDVLDDVCGAMGREHGEDCNVAENAGGSYSSDEGFILNNQEPGYKDYYKMNHDEKGKFEKSFNEYLKYRQDIYNSWDDRYESHPNFDIPEKHEESDLSIKVLTEIAFMSSKIFSDVLSNMDNNDHRYELISNALLTNTKIYNDSMEYIQSGTDINISSGSYLSGLIDENSVLPSPIKTMDFALRILKDNSTIIRGPASDALNSLNTDNISGIFISIGGGGGSSLTDKGASYDVGAYIGTNGEDSLVQTGLFASETLTDITGAKLGAGITIGYYRGDVNTSLGGISTVEIETAIVGSAITGYDSEGNIVYQGLSFGGEGFGLSTETGKSKTYLMPMSEHDSNLLEFNEFNLSTYPTDSGKSRSDILQRDSATLEGNDL